MIPVSDQTLERRVSSQMAMPLYLISALLLLSGVFDSSLASAAIGAIGLVAATALLRDRNGAVQKPPLFIS